jgi:hypothetical protein
VLTITPMIYDPFQGHLERRQISSRDVTNSKVKSKLGQKGSCCVFDDWKLDCSIGHDPLIYIEGTGLSLVENKSKMQSQSLPH